ncbi:MAG: hypothetical protein K8S56_03255 [Candidatus Cloacimonetes bacterium]|nr:hypothetical protein [Candidatus Cloacimonadota bacterium]
MRYIFSLLTALLAVSLSAITLGEWGSYTNTSHVFDVVKVDNLLYIGTWGGLEVFDLELNVFYETLTNVDGFTNHDIRSLCVMDNGEILAATAYGGVNRILNGEFLIPLDGNTGLPSNKTNKILQRDGRIYVATTQGLSIFTTDSTFPFPLLLTTITAQSGLNEVNVLDMALLDNSYLVSLNVSGINYVHTDSLLISSAWHFYGRSTLLNGSNELTDISANGNSLVVAGISGLCNITDFPNLLTKIDYSTQVAAKPIFPVYLAENGDIWSGFGYWDMADLTLTADSVFNFCKIDTSGVVTWWACDSELPTPKIMNFAEIDGKITLITWGAGTYFLEPDGNWTHLYKESIISNTISDLAMGERTLWMCNGYTGSTPTSKGTKGVSGINLGEGIWYNFTAENSRLRSNNVMSVAVDSDNRPWFGILSRNSDLGWVNGISIYNINSDRWRSVNSGLNPPGETNIGNNSVGMVHTMKKNHMWISTFGAGMNIINFKDSLVQNFNLPDTENRTVSVYSDWSYMLFGTAYSGLRIHPADPVPTDDDPEFWITPEPDIIASNCRVSSIDRSVTDYGIEYWFATTQGLFVWDTFNWFKLDTDIKRYLWDESTSKWLIAVRYFEDEPRLYGNASTSPTVVMVDPFECVWIGTESNGLCMYNPSTDRYQSWNMSNAPLISNHITCLEFDPLFGRLYIGTPDGLNYVEIGKTVKDKKNITDLRVFPNPFYPEQGDILTIKNGEEGSMPIGNYRCNIYDISGEIVLDIKENRFFQFEWNGNNRAGKKCSSGIYFYVIYDNRGDIHRGRIALIR